MSNEAWILIAAAVFMVIFYACDRPFFGAICFIAAVVCLVRIVLPLLPQVIIIL